MRIPWLFVIITMLGSGTLLPAQEFYRISAEFSVKSQGDSLGNLTMGRLFYDENIGQLIYDIRFPQEQTWVFSDSSIFRYQGDSLLEATVGASVADFSLFHLALNNDLRHYGLKGSIYNLEGVEKEGDLVISTWRPPGPLSSTLGKVLISSKANRLYGIVFFNAEEEVLRKQFFRKYENINGLEFPTELIDIFFLDEGKQYQKTNYSQIRLNETDHPERYRFSAPQ